MLQEIVQDSNTLHSDISAYEHVIGQIKTNIASAPCETQCPDSNILQHNCNEIKTLLNFLEQYYKDHKIDVEDSMATSRATAAFFRELYNAWLTRNSARTNASTPPPSPRTPVPSDPKSIVPLDIDIEKMSDAQLEEIARDAGDYLEKLDNQMKPREAQRIDHEAEMRKRNARKAFHIRTVKELYNHIYEEDYDTRRNRKRAELQAQHQAASMPIQRILRQRIRDL